MLNKFDESLRVLGLRPSATTQAIKEAYRDLVKVWHPDRFGSDARLQAKAQETLKELNAAFEQLRDYRPRDSGPSHEWCTAPPGDVPQPTVGDRPSDGPTRVLLPLVFLAALAGIVGVWLFIAGRQDAQQPFPATEVIAPASSSESRVPAAAHPVRRGAANPPSSPADGVPESAAAPTTGSLYVVSRPVGARVSFDGRVVGETPMVVTNLSPGEHQIELHLDAKGYEPWLSSVVVAAGHEEKLLAIMTSNDRARQPVRERR